MDDRKPLTGWVEGAYAGQTPPQYPESRLLSERNNLPTGEARRTAPPAYEARAGRYQAGVGVSEAAEIRAQAQEVAAGWSPPGAPESWQLTAALFRSIAGHEGLLGRLTALPPGRLPALLASASICYLVRRDHPESLAGYFPEPGQPQPPAGPALEPALAAFLTDRLDDICALCRDHRYQMNEVARCTQIALALTSAAGQGQDPGPVALIDLGTGAGLGLHLDRYRYVLADRPESAKQHDHSGGKRDPVSAASDSLLTLTCELRGSLVPPPVRLPPIAYRVGIDVNPIDLADASARAWLEACAPPEASALTRLTEAVAVARQHPVRIVRGDLVDSLPAVLDAVPGGMAAIVVDAYTAVFLPERQRAVLTEILSDAARQRPVTWLSLDPLVPLGPTGRYSVQGLPVAESLVSDYQRNGVFAVLGTRAFAADPGRGRPASRNGSPDSRILGRAHPSGQWIEWLAPNAVQPGLSPEPARHS
jgi:hypothetical protein